MDFSLPREAIERLVGPVEDQAAELLTAYGHAVLEGSARFNLVSRRSLGLVGEHMVDSAALLTFVEPEETGLADLGSGAGFPGIVVGILRPAVRVTVVDSRRSKVVFLKDMARRLSLQNVEVVHRRIEELAGERRFDLAVARALGDVEEALRNCLQVLTARGRLVLFKGPGWEEEADRAAAAAARAGAEITRTATVALPDQGRATTFVEFHVKQP